MTFVPFGYVTGVGTTGLGQTFTRASTARYRDVNGVWQSAAVDTLRSSHYVLDPSTSTFVVSALREGAGTNSALGACSWGDGTYWSGNASFTLANATSCISGTTATKHTSLGGAGPVRIQTIGVFVNAQTDTICFILENDVANPAAATRIGIRDTSAAAWLHAADLTWATKTIATVAGSGTSGVIDQGTGPNGGSLLRVYVTGTGTAAGTGAAGNSRAVYFYPTGSGTNTLAVTCHHAQFEAASAVPSSPIVTVASAVTRAADLWSFAWTRNPEAGTWYVDIVESGSYLTPSGGALFGVGEGGTDNCFYVRNNGSGKYQSVHQTRTSTAATSPALGNRVELRPVLNADGSTFLGQSINSAAEAVAATSATLAMIAWSGSRLYIGTNIASGALPTNFALRSLIYVPVANYAMADFRTLVASFTTIAGSHTLSPISLAAELSWFGQPTFTVSDTGTNTLLTASATPQAHQLARLFKLHVSFSAAPNYSTITIQDGEQVIWSAMTSATGPWYDEFDFSKKPLRASKGAVLSVNVGPSGVGIVGTVSWDGDFVRAP